MTLLEQASQTYRMAAIAATKNCRQDVINRLLETARFYDQQAKG
jgi:hypothetical protein